MLRRIAPLLLRQGQQYMQAGATQAAGALRGLSSAAAEPMVEEDTTGKGQACWGYTTSRACIGLHDAWGYIWECYAPLVAGHEWGRAKMSHQAC